MCEECGKRRKHRRDTMCKPCRGGYQKRDDILGRIDRNKSDLARNILGRK